MEVKKRLQELYTLKHLIKTEDQIVRDKYQTIQREIAKQTIYKRLKQYREQDENQTTEYIYTHEDGLSYDLDGTINKYTLTLLMELLRTVEHTLEKATFEFTDGTRFHISFADD
jgi:hypothetical protein